MINRTILGLGTALLITIMPSSYAESAADGGKEYIVEALNRDPEDPQRRMIFSANIIRVQIGDRVTFKATDPGHNSMSTPGMIPAGATPWRGGFGKDMTVTFDVPGYYGYHCLPHRGMGMVGLVIVEGDGMDANLETVKALRQPGRAAQAWSQIWADMDKQEAQ